MKNEDIIGKSFTFYCPKTGRPVVLEITADKIRIKCPEIFISPIDGEIHCKVDNVIWCEFIEIIEGDTDERGEVSRMDKGICKGGGEAVY